MKLKFLLCIVCILFSFSSCFESDEENAFEDVIEQTEDTAEQAGENVKDAAEGAGDSFEDATD